MTDITGSTGNDILQGGADNDLLSGLEGNDLLEGYGGADVLNGAAGVDTLKGGDGDDTLDGGADNDIMYGGLGNDQFDAAATTGSGTDKFWGGAGDDVYTVSGADLVFELADEGTDTINTAAFYSLETRANVENLTLTGTLTIGGTGNTLNNVINGNGSANNLSGLDGDDTLYGNGGSDTLIGGNGNDTMVGGAGNDDYTISGDDEIIELANGGNDRIRASTDFSLAGHANVENLTLLGSVAVIATGNDRNNSISGNDIANTITGGLGNDVLQGRGGNDEIYGGAGNDVLDGGAGNDFLDGGAGNDSYVVSGDDVLLENADGGTDQITASTDFSLVALVEFENLTLIGAVAISGTGNDANNAISGNARNNILTGNGGDDSLTGGSGNDFLYGGEGNDVLNSGSGNDLLEGGLGNDIYVISAGDTFTELADGGIDHIVIDSSYSLADLSQFENLTITGNTATTATGNDHDNVLFGNGLANTLAGSAGNDTLFGESGGDELFGNEGDDSLNGGAGNDVLTGGNGNDFFDWENSLRAGTDTFVGGAGDDTYVLSGADVVVEDINSGTDQIWADTDYSLQELVNVESLALYGEALSGTGNDSSNVLIGNELGNSLRGLKGADALLGGAGNDVLSGGSGADQLNGGGGADKLKGGSGNDVFDSDAAQRGGADKFIGGTGDDVYIISGADTVVEARDGGIDQIWSARKYTLADAPNVENLFLFGTKAISGTGNSLNNSIFGNDAANALSGQGGHDFLSGGLGADTLVGGAGNDRLLGGAGADKLNGNTGEDAFGFDVALGNGNIDTITGFSHADDIIHLDDDIFKKLATGESHFLPEARYVENQTGKAESADDRIIYNTNTGALYYDVDGTGSAAAVKFAVLAGAPDIDATDIAVLI